MNITEAVTTRLPVFTAPLISKLFIVLRFFEHAVEICSKKNVFVCQLVNEFSGRIQFDNMANARAWLCPSFGVLRLAL